MPDAADIDATPEATPRAGECRSCDGASGMGSIGPGPAGRAAQAGCALSRSLARATIDRLGQQGDLAAVEPEFGASDVGDTVIVE